MDVKVTEVKVEQVILNKFGKRAIRLDAWGRTDDDRQVNIEMENHAEKDNIPKRSRFYQGLIDTPILKAKNVAVIGGGNTAMDAVRTAKRLGAERAIVVYRRSEEEMPARVEEVRHAKEEGIEFMTLHNPIEYHADENGRVKEAVLQMMELGEPDESGRRSPVAIQGKTVTIAVDEVIVSVGVSPNPLIPSSVEGLEVSKRGTIVVNEQMQSSIPTLFAGGDIVRGGATVILAMADGRKAAKEMHEYLSTKI